MNAECRRQKAEGDVLVCFALKEEAAPFQKIAAGKSGISILLAGIGRQNAEKSLREFLAAHSPEQALTCGFAGGLNPDLKIGDVVFGAGNRKSEMEHELIAAGAKPGIFFCADRVATTVAEKKALRDETGADAVEMESAAIHAVCAECGIPCATIRAISDPANEDLPLDFNLLARPDKSVNYGKLILALAASPQKIGGLLRLRKNCNFAAEQLARILAQIIFR